MIVLGQSTRSFIVQIEHDELAKLMGFAGKYSSERERGEKLQPGCEVDIGSVFEEARQAIELHKEAVQSAEVLKRSASKFLGFFKE